MTCPFCSPEPDLLLAGNATCMALRDRYPSAEGHALIVPRRHVASFFDLTGEERSDLVALVQPVKELIEAEGRVDGWNISLNEGRAAGQTILHLHLHLIPRRAGDVPDPRGGIRHVLPPTARYWEGG